MSEQESQDRDESIERWRQVMFRQPLLREWWLEHQEFKRAQYLLRREEEQRDG